MNGIYMAVIGIIIIFVGTTLGSALVFFFKKITPRVKALFDGFASGIMVSASIFSLILPALQDRSNTWVPDYTSGKFQWIIVVIGVLFGFAFLFALDKIVPHIHHSTGLEEGVKAKGLSRNSKLFLAITLHNVPEGLSVGIAFGTIFATANSLDASLFISPLILAIGMALQNFPEGAAISLPLLNDGWSRKKSFLFGSLSGAVEPVAAVLGLLLVSFFNQIMPWALSFSAGCMLYVVIEELIPESQNEATKYSHIGSWTFIIGFLLMMVLDTSFS